MEPSPVISTKRKNRHTLSDIKTFGYQLLSSRTHINNLPLLLNFISPTSPSSHVLESMLTLQSFFTPLLPDLPASSSSRTLANSQEDPVLIYNTWLRSKFDEFVKLLIDVAISRETEDALKEVGLEALMAFVKFGNGGRFNSSTYHRMLHCIIYSSAPTEHTLDLLASNYFKYIDVCYCTYISLEKITKTLEVKEISEKNTISLDGYTEKHSRERIDILIQKIHYVISHIPPIEAVDGISKNEMWSESGVSSKESKTKELCEKPKTDNKRFGPEKGNSHASAVATIAKRMKLKFTKAWLSFLRLPLPVDVYKEVLATLHQAVIPYISNPVVLSDFLTRSYDIGGIVSVMALSSLFILITQHGLEYPNFYEKLYALLVPSVFMAKHRAKFFELLDSCLKSALLPAYLAAAFAKKLSRLALTVSPSGSLVIIALIHNLLRRHPSINCLVHQDNVGEISADDVKSAEFNNSIDGPESGTFKSSTKPGIDHFINEESNPMKCHAMISCLWEIETLRHHYCPPVSRFVLSLEEDLTVRAKTTEFNVKDYSSGSYATIFGEEIRRRVKQVPVAFYRETPSSLFLESDFPGWSFKLQERDSEKEENSPKRQRVDSM